MQHFPSPPGDSDPRPGQRGATAVEYGMMVALIAGVIIGIVGTLGGQINTGLTNFVNSW